MSIDTNHYKKLLEEELARLTTDLQSIGKRSPHNREDWDPEFAAGNDSPADPNVAADNVEEYAERANESDQLEYQYNEVKDALYRIKEGTYGICEKCGREIEKERLDANPAAKTCLDDM